MFDPKAKVETVYSLSSIIKRWFGELPKKIFSSLGRKNPPFNMKFKLKRVTNVVSDLTVGLAHQASSVMLLQRLPRLERNLLNWLLDLLVAVVVQVRFQ